MKTLIPRRPAGLATLVALALTLLPGVPMQANPNIRKAFFETLFTNAVGTVLDNLPSRAGHCGVCHYDFQSGGDPWNPFGLAIKNSGFALNNLTGRTNAIWYAATNGPVSNDGDAFLALFEITNRASAYPNTPTFPGLSAANTNSVVNIPLAEIALYLAPSAGTDTTPPSVTLTSPNGGQTFVANRATNVTWTAVDASSVSINLFLSLDNGSTYRQIARELGNSGTFSWVPADRPTTLARLRVVARDLYGNTNSDSSDAVFTIISDPATNSRVDLTLRDFDMPGTQPFEHGPDLDTSGGCATCHGNYDSAKEPYRNWQGSMMAHAARDPLFLANMAIANQDVANSGDLCLRCHFNRGWLAGRSVPTDGSRMVAEDTDGITCTLCHRMVDPKYAAGMSPTNDLPILNALSFRGTN